MTDEILRRHRRQHIHARPDFHDREEQWPRAAGFGLAPEHGRIVRRRRAALPAIDTPGPTGQRETIAPRTRHVLTTLGTLAALLLLAWLQHQGHLGSEGSGTDTRRPPSISPDGSQDSPPDAASPDAGAYAPRDPAPAQALPGGSLAAHEGRAGHTLERHVGRTLGQLRERLASEDKREVSTFPDLATADRMVARALFERRRDVNAWLAEGARGDTAITWRAADVAGQVLREGDNRPRPGHTVHVVLYASTRFPEGFAVRTAYVRLP